MTATRSLPEVSGLPLSRALLELEHITWRLESGRVPAPDAPLARARADALFKHCDGLVLAAADRLKSVSVDDMGRPVGL